MNALERPAAGEIPAFYQRYIDQADGRDLLEVLAIASDRTWATVRRIPAEKAHFRYAPGKWTIEQLIQHVVDSERVFAYRALCFARKDATELPGFEEDDWAAATEGSPRSLRAIMTDHDAVRQASITLFHGLTAEELHRTGIANGNRFSVRALGWAIAGHAMHHVHILNERYL
ncbi:MAG: DinB family protein [Flavobacteriales bacterium]|nr:DinB family protein [Flavobacteriales bacterium]